MTWPGQHELIGEASALSETPSRWTAVCETDVELLSISQADYVKRLVGLDSNIRELVRAPSLIPWASTQQHRESRSSA